MLAYVKTLFGGKKSSIWLFAISMILTSLALAQTKEETIKVSKGGSLSIKLIGW